MNTLRWIGLNQDKVELYRFKNITYNKNFISDNYSKIAIVDVETNGLDYKNSIIIELGIVVVLICNYTGTVFKIVSEYNHFNDPKKPLDKKIIQITHIQDQDLLGQEINWDQVDAILEPVDLIISFNAKFDRSFIDVNSKISKEKKWACGYEQLPWTDDGFPEKSQKNLCFYHGFFYDAHRAINDVYALIHLLMHSNIKSVTYFKNLIDESEKLVYLLLAKKTNFEKKNYFNLKNYSWNNELKVWYKYYESEQDANEELESLKVVYDNSAFNGEMFLITSKDRFKPIEVLANLSSNLGKEIKKNDLGKFTKEFVVLAENTPFSTKNLLKQRGYDWFESKDKTKKFWYLYVTEDEGSIEKEWLKEHVYPEKIFSGRILRNSYFKEKN